MQNDNVELMLWNKRFQILPRILNQIACQHNNKYFSRLFIGQHSRCYSIGDNDNVYSCNMIFTSIPSALQQNKAFDIYSIYIGGMSKNMFTPIDKADRNVVDAAIRQIFKNGNSLVLMKSRWSMSGSVVLKDCYSMLDACQNIGIDAYKMLIELDLSTSI